ncbi:MAG TPA: hypothetical protein VG126_12525 [Thermoleophilaceae bacterium]|nr:hypothetical protein [Thermoleophilaceae bacterium]
MRRAALAAVAVALLLAAAGCGGDDEEPAATTEAAPPPTAEPAPTATETEAPETEPEPQETQREEAEREESERDESEPETPASPEDQPGGAGDEEPARSLALFTGEAGRITPRTIRVPAFISIRVELRSEDGQEYALTFAGETIRVSQGLGSVSTTIDGLRPGEAVVGTPAGPGNRVRIEATAEPGP